MDSLLFRTERVSVYMYTVYIFVNAVYVHIHVCVFIDIVHSCETDSISMYSIPTSYW